MLIIFQIFSHTISPVRRVYNSSLLLSISLSLLLLLIKCFWSVCHTFPPLRLCFIGIAQTCCSSSSQSDGVYSSVCDGSVFTDGLPDKFLMNTLGIYNQMPKFTAVMDIIRLLWIIRIVWAVEGRSTRASRSNPCAWKCFITFYKRQIDYIYQIKLMRDSVKSRWW